MTIARPMIDRLSDAQKRALVALRRHERIASGQFGVRTNTLFSLEALGLAEVRLHGSPGRVGGSYYEARLTPAATGLAALVEHRLEVTA